MLRCLPTVVVVAVALILALVPAAVVGAATVGTQVRLTDVRTAKYAGRVIADVWVKEQKLSDLLIAANLGRPYHGGRRKGWCP